MHTHIQHPCVAHKLALLRSTGTDRKQFRELARELTQFVAYEALRDLPTKEVAVETPLTQTAGAMIDADLIVVPILRAGLGMTDGLLSLVPNAKVGFVGLYRDPNTKLPVEYYRKLPTPQANSIHMVIDPMLASGGTMVATLDMLKAQGASDIRVVCLVTCPEGLEAVETAHPDVPIFAAAIDSHLDERKYIVPGLGDAGDRLFGTE